MHLRLLVALLCLSLILVEAGDYGEGRPRSALIRKIYPSRVVVIHHHGRRGRGSGSGSNSGSGSGSGKKGRRRRGKNRGSKSSEEKGRKYYH